jgi:iron complex outermembrane recepter protein
MFKPTKTCSAVLALLGGVGASPNALAQAAEAPATQRVEVTGSRIQKLDFRAASPTITVTAEEIAANQDITLEAFLNTLPQVNPAGTSTSNNPGNNGQSNIDLRGLGPNRNLVLINGRRVMVSASDQTVDLNTIPMSLVESIEVITGGAGAVYGADAVAGVVNIKLKRRFEGIDIRAGYADSEKKDAIDKNVSLTIGGNFGGNRGNAVVSFERAEREGLIKSQRNFAAVATSTTSYFPEGTYRPTGNNAPSAAAVDALYGRPDYGANAPGTVPNTSVHSFNSDGSLFYPGIFNSPRDVVNFRYPVDLGVNTRLFPDVYVYNFDAVNLLVSPLKRTSMMGKADYQLDNGVEIFTQFGHTRYSARSALAPTPTPTVSVRNPGQAGATDASSTLVTPGINPANNLPYTAGNQLVVPTTNPFIPADLKTLLDSRTGDNPNLTGTGASEPFLMRWRTLGAGLRTSDFENTVTQYMGGAKGPISDSWSWEAHLSAGRTKITEVQGGNIDTNRLLNTLAADDGGASLCTGGVNPFGRQPLSADCVSYLTTQSNVNTSFTQRIAQAFVSGDLMQLPAGTLTTVLGGEFRKFDYTFDPGTASGPISGFNAQSPAGGTNEFKDLFAELAVPLLRNQAFAKSLDLSLAYRHSRSESKDKITGVESPSRKSNAWASNLTWEPSDQLRVRGAVQRSVRAPNFGELFDGTGSAPQIFDPCSVTSTARTSGADAAQLRDLCATAGQIGGLGTAVDSHVQTPGTQASIDIAGNPNLKPETGTSYTLGVVWSPKFVGPLEGLRSSVDYYRIKVKDAITIADSNEFIADCYNYYGNNPSYDPNHPNCAALFRAGDILGVSNLNDPSEAFLATNGGQIETEGLDFQVAWGSKLGPGKLDLLFNLNYLLSYKLRTDAQFPTNSLEGTIPYFGASSSGTTFTGEAFPKVKASISGRYKWQAFGFDARMRYIDGMENRMSKLFPGEQSFTGTPSTTYWDFGGSWEATKNFTLRVGVNNAFDQKPRTYAPNVQSGTDPSTYDVIGRRFFVQGSFQLK